MDELSEDGVLTGLAASIGVARGCVLTISARKTSIHDSNRTGRFVVVADIGTPEVSFIAIRYAVALVIQSGGTLSHAAIIARELGIPCVVQTRGALDALRDGMEVEVDGSRGQVKIVRR